MFCFKDIGLRIEDVCKIHSPSKKFNKVFTIFKDTLIKRVHFVIKINLDKNFMVFKATILKK